MLRAGGSKTVSEHESKQDEAQTERDDRGGEEAESVLSGTPDSQSSEIDLSNVDPLVAAIFLEQSSQEELGQDASLDGSEEPFGGDAEDSTKVGLGDDGPGQPADGAPKRRLYYKPAMPGHPLGSEEVDAEGDICRRVTRSYYNHLLEKQTKARAKSDFIKENGVVILTDKRMRPNDTMEIQVGAWVVHPDSEQMMVDRITAEGAQRREPAKQERKRLQKRSEGMLTNIVLAIQKKANQERREALGKNKSAKKAKKK